MKTVSCNCPPEKKRAYYANIKLFTDVIDGIPAGASPNLDMTQVVVCSRCGNAEFTIPTSNLRSFQAA